MKFLNNRLYILLPIILLFGNIYAQQSSLFKLYNEASNCVKKRDYKNAFVYFSEYIDSTEYTDYQDARLLGDSYYNIGHFYKCGHHVECNIDSAIYYLKVASLAYKNAQAARMLHNIYYYSNYNHIDKSQSFSFLKFAADLGDLKSNLELGEIYLNRETNVYTDTLLNIPESKSFRYALLRTKSKKRFPSIETDSILGYYYYERGVDINWPVLNGNYLLKKIDFIRAYMDGTYFQIDYDASWGYLCHYVGLYNDLDEITDSVYKHELGEIYWRIQMSYRFGLGTRINIEKADQYLQYSARYGYQKSIDALNISLGS